MLNICLWHFTGCQSTWNEQCRRAVWQLLVGLSNTTKLIIAWFTSTRGVYHYHKQSAFRQTVSFFGTKESPLNSRYFQLLLFPSRSEYLDGWWNSKTKWKEPGQSEGKLAVFDKVMLLCSTRQEGKLSVEKRHTEMALLSTIRQCMFKWVSLKAKQKGEIASTVFAF